MMASENAPIWFLVEQQEGKLLPTATGLAVEARRLARVLGCPTAGILLGESVAPLASSIPTDVVYMFEDERLNTDSPEAIALALVQAAQEGQPAALLLAATPLGNDVAPRVAARLGVGLASGCLRVDADPEGSFTMLRPAHWGRASCTIVGRSRPQVVTILPEALSIGAPAAANPEVVSLSLSLGEFCQRRFLQRIERPPPSDLDVTQAEVVVAGGRGVGGGQGFQVLEELARVLGGAVAASRPAVDSGWAAPSRQIGTSGKVVAPQLYIACGISGASQHVMGMRDSQTIVAINPDAYAPIMDLAHLALVGDMHAVLPPLLERLRQLAPSTASQAQERPAEPAIPVGAVGQALHCIAVCLSRSLDPEAQFDARNPTEVEAAPRLLSPADLHALEAALALKDRFPTVRVVALHMGPPVGEDVLRQALALGADDAILLWDEAFAGSDSLATARVLATAVRRLGAEMVLCGSRGADSQSGQLPLQIGELLGATAMSEILSVTLEGSGNVTVHQRREWGRRAVIACLLPAVLAVEAGINQPRYPRLRALLASRRRPLTRWDRRELGLAAEQVGAAGSGIEVLRVGPPKPVARRPATLQAAIPAAMAGGGAPTSGSAHKEKVIYGPPEELAEALFRFLVERGFAGQSSEA